MIRTFSDDALNGAIKSLSFSGEWATRLRQLLAEKAYRKASGLSIPSKPAKP